MSILEIKKYITVVTNIYVLTPVEDVFIYAGYEGRQ